MTLRTLVKTPAALLVALIALSLVDKSQAQDVWLPSIGENYRLPNCVGAFRCDDYRCKPAPCAAPVRRFMCDDYNCKPSPCATPVLQFLCAPYKCKPAPKLMCPVCKDSKYAMPHCGCQRQASRFRRRPALW